MGKVFAFHGGIHPPQNKHQSTQSPIAQAPLANVLNVPIQQHMGAAAQPCVTIGEKVLKGQRIADGQGKMSVPVHAPSSGVISAIDPHPVPHASGMQGLCISIQTDGKEQWIEHHGLANYRDLSKEQLVHYIEDRGIAGMGGAGFPTALKLNLGDSNIVNTLIINAAECEPYISADDLLMRERAVQIIAGIEVLQYLLEPDHIIIGIEDNKPQAAQALELAISQYQFQTPLNLVVQSIPTTYPSGGEKQLIQLLTNLEVPHGGIPADVGIVCQNVATIYAIHRAVCFGESLISRIVTVTGDAVAKPQNYEVLIGTPFSLLLESAGQHLKQTSRLIIGGPMMGYSITSAAIPVVKGSNCIIAATEREMPSPDPEQPCIRCGLCEQVCPAQLLPQQLHWFAKGQEHEKALQHNLFDCIECGACSYVCPSNIPLVQYYRHTKTRIREEQADKRKADIARERFEARKMREQRATDEKAAKRIARAEQAAKMQADKRAAAISAEQNSAAQPLDALPTLEVADAKSAPTNQPETSDTNAIAGLTEVQIKKLKIAAALANTKRLKAQQALRIAQDKGQPGIEQLQKTIALLESAANDAALAYQAVAGTGKVANAAKINSALQTDNSALMDSKKLKSAAAIARTKLKKAEGQLNKAQAVSVNQQDNQALVNTLTQQVQQLSKQAEQAQLAYQASLDKNMDLQNLVTIDLKKLKTSAAMARIELKKAQSQREQLADQSHTLESAATPAMIDKIQSLEHKVQQTQASYLEAKAVEGKAPSEQNTDELQTHFDKAQRLFEKASVALQKAQHEQSPAVEKMSASIDKLKIRRDNAQQALSAATHHTDRE